MHTARKSMGHSDAARARRGHGRRCDLAALNGFVAGCMLSGAIALFVGWFLARLVGVIDGAP